MKRRTSSLLPILCATLAGCAIVNSIDNRSQDVELDELRRRTLALENLQLLGTDAGRNFVTAAGLVVSVRLDDAVQRTPAGSVIHTEWQVYAVPAEDAWMQIALAGCAPATAARDLDAPGTAELCRRGAVETSPTGLLARFPSLPVGRYHLIAVRLDQDPEVSTQRAAHAVITVHADGSVSWDAPFQGVKSRRHANELVARARLP